MTEPTRPEHATAAPITGAHRRSYWKTTAAAVVACAACLLAAVAGIVALSLASGPLAVAIRLVAGVWIVGFLSLAVWIGLIVAGGLIAVRRDLLEEHHRP